MRPIPILLDLHKSTFLLLYHVSVRSLRDPSEFSFHTTVTKTINRSRSEPCSSNTTCAFTTTSVFVLGFTVN